MRDKSSINTFILSQLVSDQAIELVLCLFSNCSVRENNRRYSYSVVGRIKGVSCSEGIAEITADYGSKTLLTDKLSIACNQFIYSNQSVIPVVLDIDLQLKSILSWQGIIDINFQIKLRYAMNKFTLQSVNSSYLLRQKIKSKLALMQ